MNSAPAARLVEAREVSIGYAHQVVVHEVSLAVDRGEVLALTGPNGSGKSTFIRAALGLTAVRSGELCLAGTPVRDLSIRERARRVAWMPQDEVAWEDVPVWDYVLFGRNPHQRVFDSNGPIDRAAAEYALRAVDLWELRHRGILELSGGERQRALLARVLAQESPLLLLDEPTAHLDISHQLDLLGRVRTLCRGQGRGAVLALHDLNLAARFADRVAVLHRGRLVAVGNADEILSPTLLREVWGIVAELRRDPTTNLPYLIPTIPTPTVPDRPARILQSGSIHVVGGGGSASALLRQLNEEGYRLSAGALHLFDTDTETCRELNVPAAVEIPFAPLGSEVRRQNRSLLDAAAVVVVAPFAIGPSNLANLEDLLPYAPRVPVLLLEPQTIAERDYAGGRATTLRNELLRAGAASFPTTRELFRAVDRALEPRRVYALGRAESLQTLSGTP